MDKENRSPVESKIFATELHDSKGFRARINFSVKLAKVEEGGVVYRQKFFFWRYTTPPSIGKTQHLNKFDDI